MIAITLLGALLGLALIDSINPSAIVAAALILAKAPHERKVKAILWYVAGVYAAYFAFGVALVCGLDVLIATFGDAFNSRPAYIIQAIIGVAMLAWAIFSKPHTPDNSKLMPKIFTFRALFLLGMAVTIAEVITAFPYFGAIGLMESAGVAIPVAIALLAVYNVIFILPPLALAVVYHFNKSRFEAWLQKRQANAKPSDAMQWVVGIVGWLILQDALRTLGVFS